MAAGACPERAKRVERGRMEAAFGGLFWILNSVFSISLAIVR